MKIFEISRSVLKFSPTTEAEKYKMSMLVQDPSFSTRFSTVFFRFRKITRIRQHLFDVFFC